MQTKFFFFAAMLVAAAAVHGGAKSVSPDQEVLRNAVPASRMLGEPVHAGDDREIGGLADILVTPDGTVKEYLVDRRNPDEGGVGDAVTFPEDDEGGAGTGSDRDDDVGDTNPDYGEARGEESGSDARELQLEYLAAAPETVRYNAAEGLVEITLDSQSIGELPQRDHGVSGQYKGIYVSDITGMPVHLSDAESFGEVEDVLLSEDGRRVVAYVVDNWDGLQKESHALPADAANFQRAGKENGIRQEYGIESISFPYTEKQVDELPEFDPEDDEDSGLDAL